MFATSGGTVEPGGGMVVTDGGLLSLPVLLGSKTAPPIVVIAVPLTVRMPPMGAFGGIVLSEAFAAKAIKASRVLPDVGLRGSATKPDSKGRIYALILPTIPA
jgi:hypothetical protein